MLPFLILFILLNAVLNVCWLLLLIFDFIFNSRKYLKKLYLIFVTVRWESRFKRFLLFRPARFSTSIFFYMIAIFCSSVILVLCFWFEWKALSSEFLEQTPDLNQGFELWNKSIYQEFLERPKPNLETIFCVLHENDKLSEKLQMYVDRFVYVNGMVHVNNTKFTVEIIYGSEIELFEKRREFIDEPPDQYSPTIPFCVSEDQLENMEVATTKVWLRQRDVDYEEYGLEKYYLECQKTTSYTIISRLLIPFLLLLLNISIFDFVRKILIPFEWKYILNVFQLEKYLRVIDPSPLNDVGIVDEQKKLLLRSMYVCKVLERDFKENMKYQDKRFQMTDNWILYNTPYISFPQICYIGHGFSAMSRHHCQMRVFFNRSDYVRKSRKWRIQMWKREEDMRNWKRSPNRRTRKPRELKIWAGIRDLFTDTFIFAASKEGDFGYDLSVKEREGIVDVLWRRNYPFRWYVCRARGVMTMEENRARAAARRYREALRQMTEANARREKEREVEVKRLKSIVKEVLSELFNKAGISAKNRKTIYYHGECMICSECDIHVSFECGIFKSSHHQQNKEEEEEEEEEDIIETKKIVKCRGILCKKCAIRTCEMDKLTCPFCRTPIDFQRMILVRKDSELCPLEKEGEEIDDQMNELKRE